MNLIKKLWRGEIPLWQTFWLYGVLFPIVVLILYPIPLKILVHFIFIYMVYIFAFFIVMGLLYPVVIFVAIWRSAGKYEGRKIWMWLLKILVVVMIIIFLLIVFLSVLSIHQVLINRNPNKNSQTIEKFLSYDDNYPYVGFWKKECSDCFGLAIDKAQNGKYSVSFCGPGGCHEPGTYRPDTTIVNDQYYRVIDNNSIEVKVMDGFAKYKRCKE
jgi:hypothetical protein